MENKKSNKRFLILFTVLIILIILSAGTVVFASVVYKSLNSHGNLGYDIVSANGVEWGWDPSESDYQVPRNGKLASDVMKYRSNFMGIQNAAEFVNRYYVYSGWGNYAMTDFPTSVCLYKREAGEVDQRSSSIVTNVMDINMGNNTGITMYNINKATETYNSESEKLEGYRIAKGLYLASHDSKGNYVEEYGYKSAHHEAYRLVYKNYIMYSKYLDEEFKIGSSDVDDVQNVYAREDINALKNVSKIDSSHTIKVKANTSNGKANVIYDNGNTYIGPLTITYDDDTSGKKTFKLATLTVKNGNSNIDASKIALVQKINGQFTNSNLKNASITSGLANYYVKVTGTGFTNVNINMSISSNAETYKARILFLRAPVGENNQNAMVFVAEKSTGSTSSSASVNGERKVTKVQLQKTDSADKALSLSGIKFEIYKGEVKKGTLETGSDGKTKTTIELEAGTYKVKETVNNAYGYKQNKDVTTTITIQESDISKNIVTKNIKNTQQLGNLKILKVDEDDNNLKLVNVKFYISTEEGYLQLIGPKGAWKEKYGEATISKDNKATSSQFAIAYVKNKEDATIFKTNNDGIILLNNLEINKNNNSQYTYTIEEKEAGHDYYAKLSKNIKVKLTKDKTTYVTNSGAKIMRDNDKIEPKLTNKLSYIDLSGKVWLDVPQGKAYTGNNEYDSNDKKLKDIKVILYDTVNKKNIANTKTDENGNYKFTRVSRDNLKNYSVVFEYDGLKYTSVTLANNINDTNKSKAKEVWGDNATTEKTRQYVNSKYTNISDNGNAIKTAAGNNIVQASTQEAGDKFNLSKATIDVKAKEIKNIDLGLFTREQPDISITDDITSLIVKVKDSQYIYNYEHIGDAKEEQEAKNQTVNLTAKVAKKGKLYASDIKSFQDSVAKMEVYVIYGIQIKNESQTLKTNIKQVNEFYDIEKFDLSSGYSIGSNANNGNLEGANKYKVTEVANANGEPKLNKLEITFNQELKLEPGESQKIYLKFKLNDETVKGVLNKDVAIYNVATIAKYESNYFEGVDENGKKIETYEGSGTSRKDKIYAGLDKDSIPNNETIQFEKDGQGNNKLYDMNLKATTDQSKGHAEIDADKLKGKGNFGKDLYEDDAFSAPTFVLYADSVRKIEGTAFEDKSTVNNDNERKGNGKLDNNENKIKDITVELLEAESGNVAKYSDGITEVKTKTDKNGNYTFGKYDTSDPNNIKYLGILPGKYKIRFTYTDGTTKIVENNNEKNVSLLEYKSTIITDENIKTAMENNSKNQRWYLADSVKSGTYSVAADDYQKVTELNNLEINNELLNNMNGREMPAYSPTLEIGVEYETIDTMDVEKYEYNNGFTIKEVHTFIDKISNMDFGIVEKPHAVVQAIKRVENIIYQNAKGNTLFFGDPTKDAKIQYVKEYYENKTHKSNGKIEAEIDSDLIQGSTLKLTYALKIINESETDYNTKDYYYYGTEGTEAQKSKINITKVADYMTKDLVYDEESTNQKNEGAWIKKDLDNNFKKLIDTSIVKTDGYQILMSETYGEIKQNDTTEKYLYATVRTSTSNNTEFVNGMEILGYKGGKRIQNTTPGNYNPNDIINTQNVNPEKDSSFMITVISAPTGKGINYTPYIVITIVTLTMVAGAIVIIKRKITK